jgi:integrase
MAAGYSSAAVTMGHLALKRAIRHAEANDLVARNVAALADTPKRQDGRPSKSLTLDQTVAVITAAQTLPVLELRPGLKDVRRPAELMHAYIVLSLLCGIRTEETRALRWAHVGLDRQPGRRATGGRGRLAGHRAGVHQPPGRRAGRGKRPQDVQAHLHRGRGRGRLDTASCGPPSSAC